MRIQANNQQLRLHCLIWTMVFVVTRSCVQLLGVRGLWPFDIMASMIDSLILRKIMIKSRGKMSNKQKRCTAMRCIFPWPGIDDSLIFRNMTIKHREKMSNKRKRCTAMRRTWSVFPSLLVIMYHAYNVRIDFFRPQKYVIKKFYCISNFLYFENLQNYAVL